MRNHQPFTKKQGQPGQALIIIVFAIIGLFGIVALSIDGSHTFSVRRHMQGEADNASLSAAMANGDQLTDTYSIDTSFAENVTITSSNPPGPGCNGTTPQITLRDQDLPADMRDYTNYYFMVMIRADVPTFFGPIIGINQTHICVQSIARGVPPRSVSPAYGAAIAALNCEDKYALKISGNTTSDVINGGIFSNSSDPLGLLVNNPDNLTLLNGSIDVVGGASVPPPPYTPQPTDYSAHQIACPYPDYLYPDYEKPYTCDETYNNFPDRSEIKDVDGEPAYVLDNGKTYCITGSFKFPQLAMYGTDIHIVMINEGIQWNGNGELHLSAGITDPLKGVLIYLPYPNDSPITFNGTNDSTITGTIFAPNSTITLTGDYSSSSWNTQIIGDTVNVQGATNLTIDYNADENAKVLDPGAVELTR